MFESDVPNRLMLYIIGEFYKRRKTILQGLVFINRGRKRGDRLFRSGV